MSRDRRQRIVEVRRGFDQELAFQHAANRAYEHYRQTGRMRNGRRFGAPPKPFVPSLVPEGKINTTDPDSGVMIQKGQPPMQGYSAQAAVTTGQIVIAAEVVTSAPDYARLEPVVNAALRDLASAGVTERPATVLADAGYWHAAQMQRLVADGMQGLVPPDSGLRAGARPGWEAATTRSCAASWPPTTATRSTPNANTASNRSSARSKATAAWTASYDEAAPPSGRSGG